MRNSGPGKYREWRWGQLIVPLYCKGEDPNGPVPEEQKALCEVTHRTLRALETKGALPKLKTTLEEMIQAPDSPGGRISELRFRNIMKDAASEVLPEPEVLDIFPPPPETMVRRGSKSSRRSKGSKSVNTTESGSKAGSRAGTVEGAA